MDGASAGYHALARVYQFPAATGPSEIAFSKLRRPMSRANTHAGPRGVYIHTRTDTHAFYPVRVCSHLNGRNYCLIAGLHTSQAPAAAEGRVWLAVIP